MPKKQTTAPLPQLVPDVVLHMPVDMLMPDPNQPRKDFEPAALQELADDIKARGVQQPILIFSDYTIKTGERRWRASKLAGKETVPCLLAQATDTEAPTLERAFDQVKENHLRQALNPMEFAQFFLRLQEEFGMKVEQIAEEMERRGVKNMSRPYISNLMRLAQLPPWAQEKIKAGALTAAHGKHLLTALPSIKVLKSVQEEIERCEKRDERVTTSDLEEVIDYAFGEHHPCLDVPWGNRAPKFNTSACSKCASMHKVKIAYDGDSRYCLDDKCFDEKQATAGTKGQTAGKAKEQKIPEKAPPKPTNVTPNEHGIVKTKGLKYDRYNSLSGAPFDTKQCEGCEHNKLADHSGDKEHARPACFNVACFDDLEHAWSRNRSRREKVADYLDAWARARVHAKLTGNHDLQFQILAFMALDYPNNFNERRVRTDEGKLVWVDDLQHGDENLNALPEVLARWDAGTLPVEKITAAGVNKLDRHNLYHLARYCGVELTAHTFAIDQAYVALCKKADIHALIRAAKLEDNADWQAAAKGKLTDMQAFCLTPVAVAAIGVPREIAHLWESHDVRVRLLDELGEGEEETEEEMADAND